MKNYSIFKFCKKFLYKINFRKQKIKKIFIFEDQHTPKITKELLNLYKNLDIPIRENIFNPFDYLEKISENDIILLDNFFKTNRYEEPYGDEFLKKLLQKNLQKNFCIICISDRGKRLCEQYDGWRIANKKGWIKGWCTSKNGEDIFKIIENLISK